MLAEILNQYMQLNEITLDPQFESAKKPKLQELNIAFRNINTNVLENREINDLTYEKILKLRTYLFPETKINFIIILPKEFLNQSKLTSRKDYMELERFIPNLEYKFNFDETRKKFVQPPSEGSIPKEIFFTQDKRVKAFEVLIEWINELRAEDEEIVEKNIYRLNKKYGKDILEKFFQYLNRKTPYILAYDLGYNIIA